MTEGSLPPEISRRPPPSTPPVFFRVRLNMDHDVCLATFIRFNMPWSRTLPRAKHLSVVRYKTYAHLSW